jgi:hypothetical protein
VGGVGVTLAFFRLNYFKPEGESLNSHLENTRVEGPDGAVADIGAVIAIGDHHL